MSDTTTNEDKYTIDGIEVTSAKVIEYFTTFLRKQAYRNGRLRARIAELEAENAELSPYRDGYDFEKVKPPVGEIVLVQDCDRNFFSARKPHADCSFYESWNAEKYEWQCVDGGEDWMRWYPEPPEVTE